MYWQLHVYPKLIIKVSYSGFFFFIWKADKAKTFLQDKITSAFILMTKKLPAIPDTPLDYTYLGKVIPILGKTLTH